jgi:hypothetical protein
MTINISENTIVCLAIVAVVAFIVTFMSMGYLLAQSIFG